MTRIARVSGSFTATGSSVMLMESLRQPDSGSFFLESPRRKGEVATSAVFSPTFFVVPQTRPAPFLVLPHARSQNPGLRSRGAAGSAAGATLGAGAGFDLAAARLAGAEKTHMTASANN